MSILHRNRLLIALILLAVFLGTFSSHKIRAPKRNYADFHCFYTAGKRILNQQNIYVLRDKETAEFRYSPIFAVLISGLALMNEDNADTVWYIMNFSLLIASFILLKKLVIPEKLNYRSVLTVYILTILETTRFILHNFDSGQSNILMLSSIIAGLYYISKKREGLGGAILAFSIMVKYTPLIFIPYFILRRKLKLSLIMIISVAAYLMIPALFIGPRENFSYLKNLVPYLTSSTIFDQMTILDPKNQSLFSMINRFFTNCIAYFHAPPMPFENLNLSLQAIDLVFVILSIALYLSILIKSKYPKLDYALLLICLALFNMNAWMSNYIFLLMAYFVIIYYLIQTGFRDKSVLIIFITSYILNIITVRSILGKTLSYKLYFYSPFTINSLLAFLAILKIKFSKIEKIFIR